MRKTRREWLTDMLRTGAFLTAAPWAILKAKPATERNLALHRAAYASGSADFIHTGHMATDGEMITEWTSRDADSQWIYIDLGDFCEIRRVVLRWGDNYATAYKIQVSSERGPSPATGFVEAWSDVYTTGKGTGQVERIRLAPVKTRHVRLLCIKRAMAEGVSLREFQVCGTGGPSIRSTPIPAIRQDGTLELSGGWKLMSESFVSDGAAGVSTCGYDDAKWLPATVPGTVLTTYLDLGAVPDPFYSDHQYQVSEWFTQCRWWYRNEIAVQASCRGKRVWLNFEGINYKADIHVNGSPVGEMAGAFIRGRFDVTNKIRVGQKNCLAVLIHPVTNPCGVQVRTLDRYSWPEEFTRNAPTFTPSAGWDWLPTIPDRNIGIWNRVTISTSGDVTIIDPFLITDLPLLPDLSRADLTLRVELQNHSDQQRAGVLKVGLGDIRFAHPFKLAENETQSLTLDKSTHPELSLRNPRLWWPNGYGEQNLYDLSLRVELEGGQVSDVFNTKVGIRKLTYNQNFQFDADVSKVVDANNYHHGKGGHRTLPLIPSAKPLIISCNGQRIMLKGADWGMPEGMLRCDEQGFENRLRMEKEMNFTLIRNWEGNVAKQEFFDVCDRYGLMIWEEFGLEHSEMPYDTDMWLANAQDRLRATRNHACVALWCAANEGFTREPLRSELPTLVDALDGTRLFIQSSTQYPPTDGDLGGATSPPVFYFNEARGFHPEGYSPTVPVVESMRRMMPYNQLWPIGQMWATHNWWAGERGVCSTTAKAIAAYGEASGIEDFCRKAQMVNMEVFKAIYEAFNDKLWDGCTGVMIWMSNPSWPSLVWNTYDYYLEPTAAYFGIKKGCEPVHIQWSMASNNVKVVNCTLKDLSGLYAEARVYNLDGSVQIKKSVSVDCPRNSVRQCFNLLEGEEAESATLSTVYFIKLELKGAEGHRLSDNFYWSAEEVWKYQDLSAMGQVKVTGTVNRAQRGDACKLTINVENPNRDIALMTRLKLVDQASGRLVAPVIYSENYFSLTEGQSRLITVEFCVHNVVGSEVKVMIEGWNVKPAELATVRIGHDRQPHMQARRSGLLM